MLWAINKKAYEELIKSDLSEIESIEKSKCFAIFMSNDNRYLFSDFINKLIKPEYKEFYGYNRINKKVIKEQKWTYVKSFTRKDGISVRSYFTPSEKNVKYKSYNPESKEDIHSTAQSILLAEFLEKGLWLSYHNVPIPIFEFDIKKQNDAEKYLEVTKTFKELFENGSNYKEQRRADMLIELNSFNDKFGKGFVFEIYNSEGELSIKEKMNDWWLFLYCIIYRII